MVLDGKIGLKVARNAARAGMQDGCFAHHFKQNVVMVAKNRHVRSLEGCLDVKIGLKGRQNMVLDAKVGLSGLSGRQKVVLDGKIGL